MTTGTGAGGFQSLALMQLHVPYCDGKLGSNLQIEFVANVYIAAPRDKFKLN